MPPDFVELVRRGIDAAGSQRALANIIGVTEQTISKVKNRRTYPFNELNCVRLARLLRVPDWIVLRAAGKPELADLLEQAYGTRPVRPVRPWRDPLADLSPAIRGHALAIIRALARKERSKR